MSCLMHRNLTSCLLKQVTHFFFALEITHTLGANYALRPLTCHEMVEIAKVEWSAAKEYPCAYAVFVAMRMLGIVVMSATAMVVFVVMMSAMWAFLSVFMMMVLVAFIMMVMMLMLFFVVMMAFVMMVPMFVFVVMFFLLVVRLVKFLNPFGRGCYCLEVEHFGIE